MLVTIVWRPSSLVSARVGIIRISSSSKPNSRVTGIAMVFLVTNDADPGFGMDSADHMTVEPFFVTLKLQGPLRTNQQLPRVATQRSSAKLSVSDQRVQRTGAPVDYNEIKLLTDLHAEADLGEGCVPVGGKFGLQ